MSNWKKRPTLIEYWPEDVDYIMGIDETGTSDLASIKRKMLAGKEHEIDISIRDFTLTGAIVDKNRYDILKKEINDIKYEFWEDGLCEYKGKKKRVCFHSREIRKEEHPFDEIDINKFRQSITHMIESVDARIISCHIDKLSHYKRYTIPQHPYNIAVTFILERFCKGLNDYEMKGIVMLESRGKKEDKFLLKHITRIIENGTNQHPPSHFRNVVGVYFNPKWWNVADDKSSFVILEYADLVSYPIHKEFRSLGDKSQVNPAYKIVEQKLYRYPHYMGWGLKIWP